MADSKSKAKDERSADEIRRDIAATRARLAAGVESLVEEVHPATLKREATDRARDYVQGEFEQVKGQAKQRRKDDAKAAKKNAKLGKKNAKKYGKLDTDDSSVSNLAEKMLKQAAVLRAQAAAEREEGAA